MSGFGLAFIAILVGAGLIIWRRVLVRIRRGEPVLPDAQGASNVWSPAATGLALFWAVTQLVALAVADTPHELSLTDIQQTCLQNAVLALLLLVLLGHFGRHRFADFGLHLKHWPGQLADGALGFLAAIVPVFAVLLATLPLRRKEDMHPMLQMLQANQDAQTIAWLVLAAVVLAPVVEELMYRVVLQRALMRVTSRGKAIVGIAVLFSAVHGVPDALPLIPLALALGYVYDRRQSYLAVVLLHSLFNAANLIIMLSGQHQPGR